MRLSGVRAFATLAMILTSACAVSTKREPQSLEVENQSVSSSALGVVPKSEQLFLRGKFSAQCPPGVRPKPEFLQGQELDLKERRPTANLTGTVFEAKYFRPGSTLFANFYYHGSFYIARVPDHAVKNVYFQIWYFPPVIPLTHKFVAGHALLRFEIEPDHPIELVAPMPDEKAIKRISALPIEQRLAALPEEFAGPRYQIHNIAISNEAQWVKGDKRPSYDLIRGHDCAYTQIGRFIAMEERLEVFYQGGAPVDQFRFELQPKQGDEILAAGLRASETDGLSKLYDTIAHNCSTEAFDIAESVIGPDPRVGELMKFAQKLVPTLAGAKLESRGAILSTPLQYDESLASESADAYARVVVEKHRQDCPRKMKKDFCSNIKSAKETFQARGGQ